MVRAPAGAPQCLLAHLSCTVRCSVLLHKASQVTPLCLPSRAPRRFFFAVSGAQPGVPYKFNLVNFRKKQSLFASGVQPLLYCSPPPPGTAAAAAGGAGPGLAASSASHAQEGSTPYVTGAWLRAGSHVAYYPSPYRGRPTAPVADAPKKPLRKVRAAQGGGGQLRGSAGHLLAVRRRHLLTPVTHPPPPAVPQRQLVHQEQVLGSWGQGHCRGCRHQHHEQGQQGGHGDICQHQRGRCRAWPVLLHVHPAVPVPWCHVLRCPLLPLHVHGPAGAQRREEGGGYAWAPPAGAVQARSALDPRACLSPPPPPPQDHLSQLSLRLSHPELPPPTAIPPHPPIPSQQQRLELPPARAPTPPSPAPELYAAPALGGMLVRSMLCASLSGHRVEVLTVTDFTAPLEVVRQREAIVLTARVHPGESNASWVMQVRGGQAGARTVRTGLGTRGLGAQACMPTHALLPPWCGRRACWTS